MFLSDDFRGDLRGFYIYVNGFNLWAYEGYAMRTIKAAETN